MDETKLADELQAGGVVLDDNYITTLIKHHDSIILLEVPWSIATEYAMSDIMQHAALLLARMRTHSTKRLRIKVEFNNYVGIQAIE